MFHVQQTNLLYCCREFEWWHTRSIIITTDEILSRDESDTDVSGEYMPSKKC